MKNYPKISIVTPNYNYGEYLEDTILSVINQGYPNLEYIIIDGGSRDKSVNIIKKYEKYISYWVSEPDKGMYDAIQKGFDRSTGDIMAWLNSDDIYHSKALFNVADIFNLSEDIFWLTGARTIFDQQGKIVLVDKAKSWSKYQFYLGKYKWIQQGATFWRRDLWQQAGNFVDTSLKLAGDFELWLRFFRYNKLFVTDAALGGFRARSSNQASLDFINEYIEEASHVLNKETALREHKCRLFAYKNLEFVINTLSRVKVFNHEGLKRKIDEMFFDFPPKIVFNRNSQNFEFFKFDR